MAPDPSIERTAQSKPASHLHLLWEVAVAELPKATARKVETLALAEVVGRGRHACCLDVSRRRIEAAYSCRLRANGGFFAK